MKKDKDIGLVVVDKETAYWKKIQDSTKLQIQEHEDQLKFLREVLKLTETKCTHT